MRWQVGGQNRAVSAGKLTKILISQMCKRGGERVV